MGILCDFFLRVDFWLNFLLSVCVCQFLQMENELAREQMAESESMLRANLQGLRERNIQCEDLKGELGQLQ